MLANHLDFGAVKVLGTYMERRQTFELLAIFARCSSRGHATISRLELRFASKANHFVRVYALNLGRLALVPALWQSAVGHREPCLDGFSWGRAVADSLMGRGEVDRRLIASAQRH